ncbi:MAG: DUF512 domain-containing protein [Bacillota bacterium]
MKDNGVHIKDVLPGSIAAELGIEKGDKLISINGAHIKDILEYKFLTTDEFLELEIEKPNNEVWILELEKEYDEDIGIVFDGIIDKPRSCHNKCIFCFIDQMPKGMRDSLYFKDDDARLSFLQGNFVSLTNLTSSDIKRIIRYRISPINVSVHTTDPELRVSMLNNKNAGKALEYMEELKDNGIEMKAQIVLCPGVNDGEQLDKTLADLAELYPEVSCVAVVPVGITKYREGLYPLKAFDKDSSTKVVAQIEEKQKMFLEKLGTRFVFVSDEFYITAQKELPEYEAYEGFPQLENGVGLITLFENEIDEQLSEIKNAKAAADKRFYVITGEYAYNTIAKAAAMIKQRLGALNIEVIAVENSFFGKAVKVSGLLTGKDIMNKLKEYMSNGTNQNIILIPDNVLKDGDNIFLDDIKVEDMEKELNARVVICNQDGSDLIRNIINNM